MWKLFLIGLVGLLLLLLWAVVIEPQLLKTRHYKLSAPGMPEMRMIFASDFHFGPNDSVRLQKLVDEINRQQPDVVLLGGDFAKGHLRQNSMTAKEMAEGLAKIKASAGVFAVLGNHDTWYGRSELIAALQQNNITVLQNSGQKVETAKGAFYLAGVEDFATGHPDIKQALATAVAPLILLSHSPDVFPEVPSDVVLTLAGHTHGGQVFVPGFGAPVSNSKYGQKYIRGLIEENSRRLLVTVGLGTSVLPLRFCSLPEIVVIEWQKHDEVD